MVSGGGLRVVTDPAYHREAIRHDLRLLFPRTPWQAKRRPFSAEFGEIRPFSRSNRKSFLSGNGSSLKRSIAGNSDPVRWVGSEVGGY